MYMIHVFSVDKPGTWSSTISSPWCVLRQESKWRRSHEGSGAERRRKKGKAGKLSNGTEAKQPRDIHLMWQPCIYSHLSELCKWLLLGIKKFPSEKLALDDFGKALKSILADATEHWAKGMAAYFPILIWADWDTHQEHEQYPFLMKGGRHHERKSELVCLTYLWSISSH